MRGHQEKAVRGKPGRCGYHHNMQDYTIFNCVEFSRLQSAVIGSCH